MINLGSLKGLVVLGKTFVLAHRAELLLGTSVVSTVAAVGMAAKGGYEARGKVDAEESKLGRKLETKEKVQLTWLCYMPALGLTVGSVGSTTCLHIVHVKEKAALAQAALMAVEEAREKVKEVEKQGLGVLSNDEKQKVLEERAEKTPIGEDHNSHVENTDGELEELYLVRDAKTGRDIWSNQRRIDEAVLEVNSFIKKHGDCDLNTFYNNAGFGETPDGQDWGWSGAWIELRWDATIRDDGRPVRRFQFVTDPAKGYDRPVPK